MTYTEFYARVQEIAGNTYFTVGVETTNSGLYRWSKPGDRPTVRHEWSIFCGGAGGTSTSAKGATPEAALIALRTEMGKVTKGETAAAIRSVDADLIEADTFTPELGADIAVNASVDIPADVARPAGIGA